MSTKCYIAGCPYETILPVWIAVAFSGAISLSLLEYVNKDNDSDCYTKKRNIGISIVVMIVAWVIMSKKINDISLELRHKGPIQ